MIEEVLSSFEDCLKGRGSGTLMLSLGVGLSLKFLLVPLYSMLSLLGAVNREEGAVNREGDPKVRALDIIASLIKFGRAVATPF